VVALRVSRPVQIDTIDGEPFHDNVDWHAGGIDNHDPFNLPLPLLLKVAPGKHRIAWRCVSASPVEQIKKNCALSWATRAS